MVCIVGCGHIFLQGIQLLLQSRDAVIINHGFSHSVLIDTFLIDIDPPVGMATPPLTHTGNASVAQLNVSFLVTCSPHHYGPDCSTFCPDFRSCPECGLSGFEGESCQVNVDDCASVNCTEENTRCLDAVEGYSCVCEVGYTGQDCQDLVDHCVGVDCSGRGRCVNSRLGFTCECDVGFSGLICEVNVDDCVGVACSEHGQCEDGIDSFSCVCEEDFIGEHCQTQGMVIVACNGRKGSVSNNVASNTGLVNQ